MKNSSQYAKKVGTILRKLSPGKPKKEPDAQDPIGVIVYSFFLWESTTSKASTSWSKLAESLVEEPSTLMSSSPRSEEGLATELDALMLIGRSHPVSIRSNIWYKSASCELGTSPVPVV